MAGTSQDFGFSIIEVEALALKEANQKTIQMQWEQIIFECDQQFIVHVVSANSFGNSEFSMIISSIKNLLALHHDFEVKCVRRQANSVAHSLAKATNS